MKLLRYGGEDMWFIWRTRRGALVLK